MKKNPLLLAASTLFALLLLEAAIGLGAGAGLFRIKIPSQSKSEIPALGWFQGRMEFGTRALGARSIRGGPRSPTMQKALNLKVKYRESFRPVAPSVLREDVADWFELDRDSPYMLLVGDIVEKRRRQNERGGTCVVWHRHA